MVATNAYGTVKGKDETLKTGTYPHTSITTPTPSYTDGAQPAPVEFTSSESGSTFKCSLDNAKEEPTETCTSPYKLPEHLASGWHTFVVAATNSEGFTDPSPAKWAFNIGHYPLVEHKTEKAEESRMVLPEEGEKTASFYALKAAWGKAPEGGGVTGVTFQVKSPVWSDFKTIPTKYLKSAKGSEVKWPLPVSNNPGESEPVYFEARADSELENKAFLEEDLKFRAVFDGGKKAAGVSESVTTELSERFGSNRDATERSGRLASTC